jgi:membrane-bound serine protease (ClpP class)
MLTLIALVIALLFLSWPWSVVLVIGAAIVDIAETGTFVWWSRRKRRRSPPVVGAGQLLGRTGVSLARLTPGAAPGGQVRVEGEIWNARSEVPIDPGAPVSVSSVDGLTLTVVPAPRE